MFNSREMEAIKRDCKNTAGEIYLLNHSDKDIKIIMNDFVEIKYMIEDYEELGCFDDDDTLSYFIELIRERIYDDYSVELDEYFVADLALVDKIMGYKTEDEMDEIELLEKKLAELKEKKAKEHIANIFKNVDMSKFIKGIELTNTLNIKPLMYHEMMHWNK